MTITLTVNGDSSLLIANYFPPIQLKENYVCGLINFDTYHSIPNIDVENNLFHIGKHEIEIPVGSYELSDIVDVLITKYSKLNSTAKLDIKPNNNTIQTCISSSVDPIYFNKDRSVGPLLGFTKRVLKQGEQHYSDKTIDISKINTILIQCNIISGSYINDQLAHTLHQFSLAVPPGYKIIESPSNVIYLPVNTKTINTLILKVTDQDGNLLNFRGERISIKLHLKPY